MQVRQISVTPKVRQKQRQWIKSDCWCKCRCRIKRPILLLGSKPDAGCLVAARAICEHGNAGYEIIADGLICRGGLERNRRDAQRSECVQLAGLGTAVSVDVSPHFE